VPHPYCVRADRVGTADRHDVILLAAPIRGRGAGATLGLRTASVDETMMPKSEARMINGAPTVLHTKNPEADRAFFRDVLRLPSVDAGSGWLIFGLPPAEAAFHDAEHNDRHELFLMCDDLRTTLEDLRNKGVPVSKVSELRWGKLATLTLPSGGTVGIYQPKHPRPNG
jgi:hypothetical protein